MNDRQPIMLMCGFERAFIGLTREWSGTERAVYDHGKCVKILMKRDGMSEEEAEEYMQFNVVGAYVGEGTPLLVQRARITQITIR